MRPLLLGMGICLLAAGCSRPPVEQGRILLTKAGTGNGEVVPAAGWPPDGEDHWYPVGSRLRLEARPDRNSVFEKWEGALPADANPASPRLEVTVGRDQSFQAVFQRPFRRLRLDVGGDAALGALLPPPGTYRFRRGDVVLLQAVFWKAGAGVRWEGPIIGQGAAVTVAMEEDITVRASFAPDAPPPTFSPPPVLVSETDAPAFHACMVGGDLFGWFSATPFAGTSWGAGITRLCHRRHPFAPVFRRASMNFEHIMNGHERDAGRAYHTPRHDPIVVEVLSPGRVAVTWPEKGASWALDCRMEYRFSGGPFLDTLFEITPRAVEAPLGYLALMWASYLENALAPDIHFLGRRGEAAGWQSFRTERINGVWTEGTVAHEGAAPLRQQPEGQFFNLLQKPGVAFTEPFYYGLVDGDGRQGSTGDTMAYVMMFSDAPATRFSMWNWTEMANQPAWDWLWIVEHPQAGIPRRHQTRMAYLPFEGPEEVRALCASWDGQWPNGDPAAADKTLIGDIPPGISPAETVDDPVLLAERLLEEGENTQAEALLLKAVPHPEYAEAATLKLAEATAGPSGVAAVDYWNALADRFPLSLPIALRQGEALEKASDLSGAEAAYRRALALSGEEAAEAVSPRLLIARVLARRGGEALEAGDGAGAAGHFREAMALDPAEGFHQVSLGRALAGMGDHQGALEQCREVLRGHPDHEQAGRLLDELFLAVPDPSGRVGEWLRMTEAHPDEPACWTRYAAACADAGQLEDAESACRRVLSMHDREDAATKGEAGALLLRVVELAGTAAAERKDWQEAAARSRELVEMDPAAFRHQASLARALEESADLEGAEAAYRRALDLCGLAEAVRPLRVSLARVLGKRGRLAMEKRDWQEAAAFFHDASRLDPQERWHEVWLGEALAGKGDFQAALAQYRGVLKDHPYGRVTSQLVDEAYLAMKDPAGRVSEWQRMTAEHPDTASCWLHLGLALEAFGDTAGSETALNKARALDPNLDGLPSQAK